MATLREFYFKDQGRTTALNKSYQFKTPHGDMLIDPGSGEPAEILGRLHFDWESNSLYLSYFIPRIDSEAIFASVLNIVNDTLNLRNSYELSGGTSYDNFMSSSSDAVFSGRIYLYSETAISSEERARLQELGKSNGHSIWFRLSDYATRRMELEMPLAFISHDSRDNDVIARPLAEELGKMLCPVWYDEFSLKVGDSLRDSIEKGLRECKKCIFILSPNFLANGGWGKREYDSIFTRELVENQNVILPVWFNVMKKEVYTYSPILADRVAAVWDGDITKLARSLHRAINAS